MGLFDRILGSQRPGAGQRPVHASTDADAQAIARYRYLVRTAPPEAIEQAHAEAFARLTPEQRRRLLDELGSELPATERAAAQRAGGSALTTSRWIVTPRRAATSSQASAMRASALSRRA